METTTPFSPVAVVGTISLLTAYLVGAWCVAAGIAGNIRKNRRLVSSSVYGLYAFCGLVSVASALMIYAFVTHDFAIKYVAGTSNVSMSAWYKVTAFWGGLDGSLLFWVLILALFSTVAIVANARRHRDMIGFVVATIMIVQVFFLSLLIFTKNPFATYLTAPPADGRGLNPLLQNYWMVIHPPSLYTGFVAATIPFAFGIGALASGRLDDLWLGSVRVWMLICFGFLSLGLILGGRWAYEELGWGGYWAWDPVENAGFIPWFTATAFLHSAIIQEQRGGMKVWNMSLVVLTFFFTIFGTFMTRSGVVQSVHAFGEDNVLALQFVLFMALIVIVSVGLILYRAPRLASRTHFESFASREMAFLVNNWILLICAFFVLFATMFPTISQGLDGIRREVGPAFFNKFMVFFGLLLLVLAGAAPLLAWRKTTLEKLWNQFLIPSSLALATIAAVLLLNFDAATELTPLFHEKLRLPMALVAFGTVAFGVGSIGQEFIRGTIVRMRQTGMDPVSAMVGLMVMKRRKYGGYIVHLGVCVMFVGFAGKTYDRQLDATIGCSSGSQDGAKECKTDKDVRERKAALDAGLDPSLDRATRVQFAERYMGLEQSTIGALKAGQLEPLVGALCPRDCELTAIPAGTQSAFEFGTYTFLFERLMQTSDAHKDAVTAQVSIWQDGELINRVYPAKWDHRRGEEATTEVSITVRLNEDVYVILTGYNTQTMLGNFRVYINPLISWVWIGFLILLFGTLICLIPQFVVDAIAGRDRSGGGGGGASAVGKLVAIALVSAGLLAGAAGTAHAAGGEHVPAGMGMGDAGTGYAAQNRPDSATAQKAMKECVCVCGCPRESIFDCKCATASQLRGRIMAFLNQTDASGKPLYDLSSDAGRERAYDEVLEWYVKEYNGEHVLLTPRSSASWILPALAVVGGLTLLFVVGWRFTTRGRAAAAAVAPAATAVEDDVYAEKLDDELAKTD